MTLGQQADCALELSCLTSTAGGTIALSDFPDPSCELLRRTFETAACAAWPPSENEFRRAVDAAPVFIWTTGPDHCREFFNKRWLDFRGRKLHEEIGDGWTEGLHPSERERVVARFVAALETRRQFEMEYQLRRRDGRYRWLMVVGAPRFGPDDDFLGFVGGGVDITDQKEAQHKLQTLLAASDEAHAKLAEQAERLTQLAECDPLTGMLNRRSFRDQFRREWDRAVRYRRAMSCVMLDLDFFKKVNDTHGHAAGDIVLQRVAEMLIKQCRPSDRVCRYGGEEFCIVAPETTESGAAVLAERLRRTLSASPIEVDGKQISVASSFGVAERVAEMHDMDELIERADQMLRVAKHSGRNQVIQFALSNALNKSLRPGDPSAVLSRVLARDLAIPTVSIHLEETVQFAVDFLLRRKLGSAPVVDDDGRIVGSISDRDLLMDDFSPENWSRRVREVMKTNVVVYDETTPGDEIFQFLCRVAIQQIVVVKDGRPIGVINLGALLNHFQRQVGAETLCAGAV